MPEHWLEISDRGIDERRVEKRVEARQGTSQDARTLSDDSGANEDPVTVASALWAEVIGEGDLSSAPGAGLLALDCDIVPRRYVIDWQTPIIGPIYAFVRRIINEEIRRYLMPSLEKQTLLNQALADALHALAEENDRLRQEIAALRNSRDTT